MQIFANKTFTHTTKMYSHITANELSTLIQTVKNRIFTMPNNLVFITFYVGARKALV